MAKLPLVFKDAEKARDAILASQKKEIEALYENWADEIASKAKYYARKTNPSAAVSEQQMRQLYKQIKASSKEVSNEIYNKIKSNLYMVADATVKSNNAWLASLGFDEKTLGVAFSNVPDAIVKNLITGQIYDSGWSLSKRIWSDNEQTLKDIYQVVAKGMTENKPLYDIAKDLESYVRPNAKLPWNLRMSDGVKIYKKQVDYNAQRLARTLVQHGYQQSFIATTQKNPFITEYVWHSNGSRVCEICMARDGQHFKKDQLPMDHPNGMCTMEPVVADDMTDQLADWFNSPDGTYPEIDEFAGNFGYKAEKGGTVESFINKYGTSTKSPNAWFNGLTQIQKAEAKLLKDQSGLTWNKWYEKNIYTGNGDNLTAGQKKTKVSGSTTFSKKTWMDMLKKNKEKELREWTDAWVPKLTKEELKSVQAYTGSAYFDMNRYLRGLERSTDYKDKIKLAKDALKKAQLPRDTIVRRGSGFDSLKNLLGVEKGSEIVPNKDRFIGAVIQDKGFMSTSPIASGGFSGDIEYIIHVPEGANAMYVDSISLHEGERELLINAGSKFVVEDMEINEWKEIKKVFLRMLK